MGVAAYRTECTLLVLVRSQKWIVRQVTLMTAQYLNHDLAWHFAAIAAGLEGASSAAAGDLRATIGTQRTIPIVYGAGIPFLGGSAAVTGKLYG